MFVENGKGQPKWLAATITEKIGSVMYRVQVNNESWRRHADQIRVRKAKQTANETADYSSDEDFESQPEQVVEQDDLPAVNASPIATPTEESNVRSPVARDRLASELVQEPVVSRYPRRTHVPPDHWIEHC